MSRTKKRRQQCLRKKVATSSSPNRFRFSEEMSWINTRYRNWPCTSANEQPKKRGKTFWCCTFLAWIKIIFMRARMYEAVHVEVQVVHLRSKLFLMRRYDAWVSFR